jgi:hypothetical protein
MKRAVLAVAFSSLLIHATALISQEVQQPADDTSAPRVIPPEVSSMQQPIKVHKPSSILEDGTPVSLRLITAVKSKQAQVGDAAEFVLDHDLWNRALLLAREGTSVEAVVVEASKAKWGSRGGKLAIDIQSIKLLNGQRVPLRGTPSYKGGAGPVTQVTGGLALEAANPLSNDFCPVCSVMLAPVVLVSLIGPGTNKNLKANTVVTAWVNGSVSLDFDTLRSIQPDHGAAQVAIVRGNYGSWSNRDLYCNGVPLAHIGGHQKLQLELQPGWYRFAINPKKQIMEIYAGPGTETKLITDHDHVYIVNQVGEETKLSGSGKGFAADRSMNTRVFSWHDKQLTELEYLQSAKPVKAEDRYPTECHPLSEVPDDH